MSTLETQDLYMYQGEDFSFWIGFQGDDAPTTLVGWQAYMEIREQRSGELVHRLTTDLGEGITISDDFDYPAWVLRIPKAVTRTIEEGVYDTDVFAVPPGDADTFPCLRGRVYVQNRFTVEEE